MNKKIINSSVTEGFKSKLEKRAYELFITAGFNVQYEPEKYILWKGDTVDIKTVRFKKGNISIKNKHILRDITYTPDFKVEYNNKIYIIETKGFRNDVFPLKYKLYLSLLSSFLKAHKFVYVEPCNISDIKIVITKIKNNEI